MQLLHESSHTRPTQLDFLHVDYYDARADAISEWLTSQQQHTNLQTSNGFSVAAPEGEFEVDFAPHQPTGLRFTEGYIMMTLLRLAAIDSAMYQAVRCDNIGDNTQFARNLLDMVLIRIGSHSVLGAPVADITALMYAPDDFPKQFWLASPERLQDDYHVVTIATVEQLKWLCFVPAQQMMEVPMVSFAASSTTVMNPTMVMKGVNDTLRSDGIRAEQYLMEINGIPMLEIGATTFIDEKSRGDGCSGDGKEQEEKTESVIEVVTQALQHMQTSRRTLKFRDLKAYKREALENEPLSPWNRRSRRCRASSSYESVENSSKAITKDAATEDGRTSTCNGTTIEIIRKPRHFFRLILEELAAFEQEQAATAEIQPLDTQVGTSNNGWPSYEGIRRGKDVQPSNLKTFVIPDNLLPVGIQLETELMATFTIFKGFTRLEGPAKACKKISRGDTLVAINNVPVEDIPTDQLIRMLRGKPESKSTDREQQQQQQLTRTSTDDDTEAVNSNKQQQQQQEDKRYIRFARKKPRRMTALLASLWGSKAVPQEFLYENDNQAQRRGSSTF